MKKNFIFSLLLFVAASSFAQTFQPVNKNASTEAKKLLSYLYSIDGKNILSGEHGDERWLDTVKNITGKYPAVKKNQDYPIQSILCYGLLPSSGFLTNDN